MAGLHGCAGTSAVGSVVGRRDFPHVVQMGMGASQFLAWWQVGIPEPPIMELSVRGATNTYTDNGLNSVDTEMALDMQVRSQPQTQSPFLASKPRPRSSGGLVSRHCHDVKVASTTTVSHGSISEPGARFRLRFAHGSCPA